MEMKDELRWSGPFMNPFEGVMRVADDEGFGHKVHEVLCSIVTWWEIEAETFLDDVLQEIAGATNIVALHRDDGWYVILDK